MLILNAVLLCAEAYMLGIIENREKHGKAFCVLACIQAIFLSGLRHIHVGMDTYNYWGMFERAKDQSWLFYLEQFSPDVFFQTTEPGYFLSLKAFQLFSDDFRIYLIVFACFVNIPIFKMIYKECEYKLPGVLLYMSLYFAFLSTTGLRQTSALMLTTVLGFRYIRERKLVPYLLCCVLAFTFHKTALLMIPFYFIAHKKIKPLYLLFAAGMTAMLFVFRNQFAQFFFNNVAVWYEGYGQQYSTAGTPTFSLFTILIAIAAIVMYKPMSARNPESNIYVNASIVACIFLPLTFVDPSNLRAVFYFSFYSIMLVPKIIAAFSKPRDRTIVYLLVVVLLMALIIKSSGIYRFYWQPGIYDEFPSIV